jgi:archaellum biogenesis ATPase FlaH
LSPFRDKKGPNMNLEQEPEPTPPGDENDNLKQIGPDITPQTPEQSTQQGSSMAANESDKSKDRLSKETREQQRQELNAIIARWADLQRIKGLKEREIEAEFKKLYEQIKQNNNGPLGNEPLIGTILSEVETQQVDWLWQRRIPLGKITILDGDPGMGKSLLAINIAACVSTGRPMPDGTPGRKGSIILIAPEDNAEDTIKPRIEAVGGDPSQVLLLNTIDIFDEKLMGIFERPFSLSRDMKDLEDIIKRKKAILVVIDPLMAVLGRNINSSSDQEIRVVLTPLGQLAERTGCAILIIRHLNKGSSDNILYRGAGSIGIIAAARIGLLVAHDPDDEQKRVFATIKNNLSKIACNLTYQVVENERGAPYIQWLGENHHTTSTLLRPGTNVSYERQEILRVLKEADSPLDTKEISEQTGLKYDSLRLILNRMYKAGDIAHPYRGKYTSLNHPSISKKSPDTSNDTSDTTATSDTKPANDLPTSEE